jgi:hypothetical protein
MHGGLTEPPVGLTGAPEPIPREKWTWWDVGLIGGWMVASAVATVAWFWVLALIARGIALMF